MEQLQHFSHEHLLNLVQLQFNHNHENSDKEYEENEAKDDSMAEGRHVGKCKMCDEEIYYFHLCFYCCKDCDYSLHKFCAQLPTIQQNHTLHPSHNLTLSLGNPLYDPDVTCSHTVNSNWDCDICEVNKNMSFNYHCHICKFTMDITCATMFEQVLDHPSHPHQLQRNFGQMTAFCCACNYQHFGTFYRCTTCSWFRIHLVCALLPTKLLIQKFSDGIYTHPHILSIAYSFPYLERKAKFFPVCRVCDLRLRNSCWHYRCNKCQYYVHPWCAATMRVGIEKSYKTFKDEDYPNLIHFPFADESFNLLKHYLINKDKTILNGNTDDGERFNHEHPLILFGEPDTLHDPMKRVELLCDGCVRPIMDLPFYKCSQHDCDFVLHEWCNRLPSEVQNHPGHQEHPLLLILKTKAFSMFSCRVCYLPCNGFKYGCIQCGYYVDVNCGFIPDVITHDAHPNHLLLRFETSVQQWLKRCKACMCFMQQQSGFYCPTCDFYLHIECALFLSKTIKHKFDKHPLTLRYYPVENYVNEYFCDICEDEFNPKKWFYHCGTCSSFIHTACSPIKQECEKSLYSDISAFVNVSGIFWYLNVKFGGTVEITGHPHHVTIIQGIDVNAKCMVCDVPWQNYMILKCFLCKFACHVGCESKNPAIQ